MPEIGNQLALDVLPKNGKTEITVRLVI